MIGLEGALQADAKDLLSLLDRVGTQGPAAIAMGINRTVEEGLAFGRDHMRAAFIIREPRILPPHLLPKAWRARPDKLEAPIQLGDQEGLGARRRQIFSKFEEGGQQLAQDPVNFPFAVPTSAVRSSPRAVIPKKMMPRQLVGRFDQVGISGRGHLGEFLGMGRSANSRTRLKKLKGGNIAVYRKAVGRYFVLGQPGDRHYGIYERTGSGQNAIRALWLFLVRRQNPSDLNWIENATKVASARLHINVEGALAVILSGVK